METAINPIKQYLSLIELMFEKEIKKEDLRESIEEDRRTNKFYVKNNRWF